MTTSTNPLSVNPFTAFYRNHFLAEHRNPANVALHVFGTLASTALLFIPFIASPFWLLLYPALQILPGLLGHRLFERNPDVGDLRVGRTDFPFHWFIAANYVLTAQVLAGRFRRV